MHDSVRWMTDSTSRHREYGTGGMATAVSINLETPVTSVCFKRALGLSDMAVAVLDLPWTVESTAVTFMLLPWMRLSIGDPWYSPFS